MITDLLEMLPAGIHIGVGLVFIAGLVVWAFGRRLLRPMLVLASLATGASVGLVVAAMIPESVSVWWPIGLCAGFFALIGLAAYRFMMAAMLAISLGLACPLGYFTYTEITGLYDGSEAEQLSLDDLITIPGIGQDSEVQQTIEEGIEQARDIGDRAAEELLKDHDQEGTEAGDSEGKSHDEEIPAWRRHLTQTARSWGQEGAILWQDAPGAQKVGAILASVAGIVCGILIGILLPKISGAVVTALVGSLIVLTTGTWLATRFGASPGVVGFGSSTGALTWWILFSLIGLVIQFKSSRSKADKE